MNVRLKQFVTIQRLKDKLIISGTYKEGDIYLNESSEMIDLLDGLKNISGLPYDKYKDNEMFVRLYRAGLLEDIDSNQKRRNELFYDYIGYDFQGLKSKHILIFGAGAAGGTIAYMAAQQGFTHIACVDSDKVEKSDVDKTMVYDVEDIGEYKVNAIKKRILKNFNIGIISIVKYMKKLDDAFTIIETTKPDIIIYAVDPDPVFKMKLNEYCVSQNLPIIHSSYSYEKIICGPCVVPHETACMIGYNEYWKMSTGYFDFNEVVRLFGNKTIHPSISFNINVLAGIILKDVVFCIGKKYDYVSTINKQIIINLLKSEITEMELSCQFCGDCIAKSLK